MVILGFVVQFVFGLLLLRSDTGRAIFDSIKDGVNRLLGFTMEGVRFLFGPLLDQGLVFAFKVLPTIIFFSSLMSVLYYLGVMQMVVKAIAWVMQRTLGTSGAETLSASGNIFLGQTEAPLLIKPFVGRMTQSELVTVMVGGFATVAGGVMAAYVAMLQGSFPSIAGHLLAASVMNAPAGLLLSKMILPEKETPVTKDTLHIEVERTDSNVIEAAASGALTGLQLALNVAAMLMAFIALIAMLNFGIAWLGQLAGYPGLSLQLVLGTLLRPLAWVMGVPWQDTQYVGGLIGIKTVLNEFVAYLDFARPHPPGRCRSAPAQRHHRHLRALRLRQLRLDRHPDRRHRRLAPERRGDLARLGLRAMIAGNLAAFMSASLAGMLM